MNHCVKSGLLKEQKKKTVFLLLFRIYRQFLFKGCLRCADGRFSVSFCSLLFPFIL